MTITSNGTEIHVSHSTYRTPVGKEEEEPKRGARLHDEWYRRHERCGGCGVGS